jgi:hypothetical protein
MFAFLFAAVAFASASDGGVATSRLEPRAATWSELQAVFPEEWALPEAVWAPRGASKSAEALPFALEALVEARFETVGASDANAPAWTRSFGDLVKEARRRGAHAEALDGMLAELRIANPQAHSACAALLREVVLDKGLRSKKWTGEKDLADDGLFFGPLLKRHELASGPWKSFKGSHTLHQAAALVQADLEALKGALNDYPSMLEDPGTSYERLGPVAGSFLTGRDETRGPFAALRIAFRSDLPFPFTHYDCELGIFDLLDAKGRMTTYVYASGQDFHWFAGRDVHYPVRSSDGEFQGLLLVRVAGFDLKGVPDGDSERLAGTRVALGNLKRRSEAAFKAFGGPPRTLHGALPSFDVIAERP